MPSAPAAMAISAAFTGSGWRPPRALRTVATWSMLTPRRMGGLAAMTVSAPASGLAVHALGVGDHLLRPQLRDDRSQVLEIVDRKIDRQIGEIGRLPQHSDVVDIAIVLGDDLGDLRQCAGLIDRLHCKLCRKPLRHLVIDIPAHVEPALRLVLELLQRLRLNRIDRDALT